MSMSLLAAARGEETRMFAEATNRRRALCPSRSVRSCLPGLRRESGVRARKCGGAGRARMLLGMRVRLMVGLLLF